MNELFRLVFKAAFYELVIIVSALLRFYFGTYIFNQVLPASLDLRSNGYGVVIEFL